MSNTTLSSDHSDDDHQPFLVRENPRLLDLDLPNLDTINVQRRPNILKLHLQSHDDHHDDSHQSRSHDQQEKKHQHQEQEEEEEEEDGMRTPTSLEHRIPEAKQCPPPPSKPKPKPSLKRKFTTTSFFTTKINPLDLSHQIELFFLQNTKKSRKHHDVGEYY